MTWAELMAEIVPLVHKRGDVRVQFMEQDGSRRGNFRIIGPESISLLIEPSTPMPAAWTKIPPRCPPALMKLLISETLMPPPKIEAMWRAIIDHYDEDDIPF
jgi:hypothetical protein